ncbi:MAG: DUF4136 domain-containing protein [Janthinobacterium lividum]
MKTLFKPLVLILFTVLSSCGTATLITGSWRKPDATATNYKRIFISAITSNVPAKQGVENGLAQILQQRGLTVIKSIDAFPPNYSDQDQRNKTMVMSKIMATNPDAILTITLINKEHETHYVHGGGGGFNPGFRYGYYNNFWSYYNNWYPYMYNPGYYVQDKVYYLETNLYDAKSEQLIWSAQSKTYNPSGIDSFLKGYVKSILKQMTKDGLIAANKQ